jgi:hypothetical protein
MDVADFDWRVELNDDELKKIWRGMCTGAEPAGRKWEIFNDGNLYRNRGGEAELVVTLDPAGLKEKIQALLPGKSFSKAEF